MSPAGFVAKWKAATLKESSAAQEHFTDLCCLLGEPTPAEADPNGEWFCFEKGASIVGGGDGWADVWRRGCFGWEYKGKGKDLKAAFKQLQLYSPALEYPPLLIVSDIASIVIHTAFTGTVPAVHILTLDDLLDAEKRRLLKWAFTEPQRLRPGTSTVHTTAAAAERFASLATALRARGHDPASVAHFLNRLLFCLFAEDTDLLPAEMFTKLLQAGQRNPAAFLGMLTELFHAMANGGRFGYEIVDWFNGGLFDTDDVLPLEADDLKVLVALGRMDWSAIEPSIFGTLFERGLDPDKRSQLGAHYTDPGSIMRLVNPVVVEPLRDEWAAVKAEIAQLQAKASAAREKADKAVAAATATQDKTAAAKALTAAKTAETKAMKQAEQCYRDFLDRLAHFRVLDAACGSGNFLYLALRALKDLEHEVILEAEALGFQRPFPRVGPDAVLGIELNPYAAELARVTVWIGEIQWMLRRGFNLSRNPILKPLGNIETRDAILSPDGTEPDWPAADAIIGNPPFLGDKRMLSVLGEDYVSRLRALYKDRVPGGADLVTYWFEKARAQIQAGRARLAGLVATNSIRGGANRKVLERIRETGEIFNAWSDEPWINEGAAVRVSLIGFGLRGHGRPVILDGESVPAVYSNLTIGTSDESVNLTLAKRMANNAEIAFLGIQKTGPFEIAGSAARQWLGSSNPDGRPNSDVVKPWYNGLDITRRPRDMWIVDYGVDMSFSEAALYEAPFAYVQIHVKPTRVGKREKRTNENWWIFQWARPLMRKAVHKLPRFIVTPEVSKHRVFAWMRHPIVPDKNLIVIAHPDDTAFGVLHSRFHELWALRMGTSLEDRPRYTPTTTFETFPFPEGLTPNLDPADYTNPHAQAIANAARTLNELRENWLNPPELVKRVPEVVEGYPDRLLPADANAEKALKQRTLTNLYNARPAWLDNAHKALDAAVAAAYSWDDYSPDMPEEEILARLLALNLERSRAQDLKAPS